MRRRALIKCSADGCETQIPPKHQWCWECATPYCDNHLTLCSRCQRFKLCVKCFPEHKPYCERELKARGRLPVQKEIGNGAQYVYLWYNSADQRDAQLKGESAWPCKIGRSVGSPTSRIVRQGA